MVLRALLTIWFFVTSALGPALCCCTVFVSPKAAHAASRAESKTEATPARSAGCPHCHEKPSEPSPAKQSPSDPQKPCPGKCPCPSHSLTNALPDQAGHEARVLASFAWIAAAPALVAALTAPLVDSDVALIRRYHTGPPPLSGVERLHRLHVLVC